ncbi:MAG: hypothetical protein ABI698_10020 [bacterium]
MAKDPGLSADTCIFMESTSGDGGVHTANVWWLSPDIILTGPVSGADKADPGQINSVDVTIHRKSAESNCLFPGDEQLLVELWVGNPAIAMTPNNNASTRLILQTGSIVPLEGTTGTQHFDWTPPSGLPASDPQSPGHKCLIARAYPDSLTASQASFFAPEDQHVVQRNICVVPCGGPGAARKPGPCGFDVLTANVNAKEAEQVTIAATLDLKPNQFVRRTVLQHLEKQPGFRKLATRPPRSFRFELRDFPNAKISDHSTPRGCLALLSGGQRRFEASLSLAANQVASLHFVADLHNAEFGDALIFHLTQTGPAKERQGGLTLVMVAG